LKALIKTKVKDELRIEERNIPILNDNELLVQVEYCGVCGSDLHAAAHAKGYEFVPKPIVLGHEISGTVMKVGNNVNKSLKNSRVIIKPVTHCGECEQCKKGYYNICSNILGLGLHYDGGMAEYIKVSSNQIIVIPDDLPFDVAALAEPLYVAIHAVERINDPIENKSILVQGCGIIGIFTAIVAKLKKGDVIISGLKRDWEHRLRYAEEIGIKTEIFEEQIETNDQFDFIFECSGSSIATEKAINRLKKGAEIILVALYENYLQFPINGLVRSEINVISSYSSNEEDFYKSIKILMDNVGKFDKFIKKYPLIDGVEAFNDAKNQRVLKPLLKLK